MTISGIGENMEDRYLCKAKRTDKGQWVIGFYAYINKKHYIYTGQLIHSGLYDIAERFEVDPSTICQCTGLKDKNGKLIWENDIVEAWSQGLKATGKVRQRIDGLWLMYPAWQKREFWGLCPNNDRETTVEVIGNIFDNPELLESEEKQ